MLDLTWIMEESLLLASVSLLRRSVADWSSERSFSSPLPPLRSLPASNAPPMTRK